MAEDSLTEVSHFCNCFALTALLKKKRVANTNVALTSDIATDTLYTTRLRPEAALVSQHDVLLESAPCGGFFSDDSLPRTSHIKCRKRIAYPADCLSLKLLSPTSPIAEQP